MLFINSSWSLASYSYLTILCLCSNSSAVTLSSYFFRSSYRCRASIMASSIFLMCSNLLNLVISSSLILCCKIISYSSFSFLFLSTSAYNAASCCFLNSSSFISICSYFCLSSSKSCYFLTNSSSSWIMFSLSLA